MKVGTDAVLLGSWANSVGKNALDVGTGCGIVALMLAQRFPNLQIRGIDIHEDSVEDAQFNFERSPWQDRLLAEKRALQSMTSAIGMYDLIVSNPPYFQNSTSAPSIHRHNARHTSNLGYEELTFCSAKLLTPNGSLAVILPAEQLKQFIKMAHDLGLYLWRQTTFLPKAKSPAERVLLQFLKQPTPPIKTKLVHYTNDGEWTTGYKGLTKEFYLKL